MTNNARFFPRENRGAASATVDGGATVVSASTLPSNSPLNGATFPFDTYFTDSPVAKAPVPARTTWAGREVAVPRPRAPLARIDKEDELASLDQATFTARRFRHVLLHW